MARLTKKVFRGLKQLSLLGDAYPKSIPAECRQDVKVAKAWIEQEYTKRASSESRSSKPDPVVVVKASESDVNG
jgi:hypothetical protein